MSANSELAAAGITDPALVAGYRACRHLNAQHGRTYFLATLLLPPEKRPYVHALYGFARHVDDLVDEGGDLAGYTDTFLAELEWGATSDPVTRAVLDTIARWNIPHSYFADFIESMRMDLRVTSYATFDDLKTYMWGSAAVVGLQMLPILGRVSESMPWDALEPHAIDLGYAFQLTNFIRDVGEDLERGRIYLPQDSLAQFNVTTDQLQRAWRSGIVTDSLRNLLAFEIERARGLYRSALAGVALVHPTSQDCLSTALTLYGEILDEIESRDYNVFLGRVHVGLRRRASVGISGLLGARSAQKWKS